MERLLLANLAINQAFDRLLQEGSTLRALAGAYIATILLETNEQRRAVAIASLERRVIDYFEKAAQPSARRVGEQNAHKILAKLEASGISPDLNNPLFRRKVLIEGAMRPQTRVQIVRKLINDRANTLENRLSAYWLEPGQNPKQKLDRLVELHRQQERSAAQYQQKLSEFYEQVRETRPPKPQLDYLSRFTNDSVGDVREQARRSGTDAETAAFEKAGFQELAWVTVNASQACPDCRKRQGLKGDAAFWNQLGRPGAGTTLCASACMCLLVPSETLRIAPQLEAEGLNTSAASRVTHAGLHL